MALAPSSPAPVSPSLAHANAHDHNVDVLRGLAAVGVALYHFSRSDFLGSSAMGAILHRGYLGVHAFFVVSGYVIPLALTRLCAREKRPFRLGQIPAFLGGRWIRLYPAFAASAVLSIALWYASALAPGFKGGPPSLSGAQLAANTTLSCDFLNLAWINPVFWTLAIEAQYYLAIALCFPLLTSTRAWWRWLTILVWIAVPLALQTHGTLFPFGATFALGLILFGKSQGLFSTSGSSALFVLALAVSVARGDGAVAIAGAASVLFLLFMPTLGMRGLRWLGTISYSLYLMHVPIGGRVINLSERLTLSFPGKLLAIAAALTASLLAAELFYRWIERPSHEASRRWTRRHSLRGKGGAVSSLPATK